LIILLPVVLIIFSFKQEKKAFLKEYNGNVVSSNQSETKKVSGSKLQPAKNSVSAENKAKSTDFTDSASIYNEDYGKAVAFYKLAISFNKYNYRAWYGLVNTYYSMKELKKAKKAQDEMRKLFGERVFDIGSIIQPFGELETAELRSDSSYFLEYTTEASSRETLVNETFQIVRALKPTCNCVSIAIFAQKSAGKGLIVHIKNDKPIFNLTDYKAAAVFTYLE
jgi:tetratricopeptide (TPR) repeat protein